MKMEARTSVALLLLAVSAPVVAQNTQPPQPDAQAPQPHSRPHRHRNRARHQRRPLHPASAEHAARAASARLDRTAKPATAKVPSVAAVAIAAGAAIHTRRRLLLLRGSTANRNGRTLKQL